MSLKLAARFAYTLEPVSVLYKMPWKYHLPQLPLQADTAQAVFHLVGEAAPFVFQRTAGYALMSFARLGSNIYQLAYHKTNRWEKTKIGLDIASLVSPVMMVFLRITPSYFIAAQVAKIVMELKDERGLLPMVSHAFFLVSLWRGCSYKIRLASIVFQGAVAYYQAYKKGKKLDGFIWALIGTLRCYQGYQYYQLNRSNEPKFVYKQRHAEKDKKDKSHPLTEHGHEQSRLTGPLLEKYLQDKTGKTKWVYASSTMVRAKQTAQGMLQGVGRPDQPLFMDGRLSERIKGEPKSYMHARQEAAIDDLIDEVPGDSYIVVDHSIVGREYARQVDETNEALTKHHLKYVEGILFKRLDGITALLDRFRPVLK